VVISKGLVGTLTIEFPPEDPSHLFFLQRDGQIYRFQNSPAASSRTLVKDLRPLFSGQDVDGQSGLMDMAFHPDFARNGELYVAYTVPGAGRASYVARYTSLDGGETFSQNGQIVLTFAHAGSFHGVGTLDFGPEGYLYISLGDGGPGRLAGDPFELNGKLLRVDVDSGTPYGIPPDNPYASGGGAPEVFASGLRNPWRVSVDDVTGDIWGGDVGNHDWEEINKIESGNNYGWNTKEGAECTSAGCDDSGLIDPAYTYSHNNGCAVIGGHVYRGAPSLRWLGNTYSRTYAPARFPLYPRQATASLSIRC